MIQLLQFCLLLHHIKVNIATHHKPLLNKAQVIVS